MEGSPVPLRTHGGPAHQLGTQEVFPVSCLQVYALSSCRRPAFTVTSFSDLQTAPVFSSEIPHLTRPEKGHKVRVLAQF